MTIEEAEMIVSQLGWKPSVRPTEREPHLFARNACITGSQDRKRLARKGRLLRMIYPSGAFDLEARRKPEAFVTATADPVLEKKNTKTTPTIRRCRSEEHTSELQSLRHLVCRLLL